MIKHVIFTDESLAKVFCYDLAKTLSLKQQRAGTLAYSIVMPHPIRPATFSVMVDDTDIAAMALVTLHGYMTTDLDSTWFPVEKGRMGILP